MWPFANKPKDPEILINELSKPETSEHAFNELLNHPSENTDSLVLAALASADEADKANEVMLLALIAIAGKRRIDEALPLLKPLFASKSPKIQTVVLQALTDIGSQAALDAMIAALTTAAPTVKQSIRNTIISIFGKEALGALVRAVPENRSSNEYFEIVSIMEELNLFADLKDSFSHPDPKIRDFYFDILVKFSRPDFIQLFIDFYEKAPRKRREQIIAILREYSVAELAPCFTKQVIKNSPTGIAEICDRVLINRFTDGKNEILRITAAIDDIHYRSAVLPELFKRIDPYCFDSVLEILLNDSSAELRASAQIVLSKLVIRTFARIKSPKEPNKASLTSAYDLWENNITALMRDNSLNDGQKKLIRRLYFSFAFNRPLIIRPFIFEMFQKNFHETCLLLQNWPFGTKYELFRWLIETDSSFGSLLISSLHGNTDVGLWRLVLCLMATIADEEEKALFKSNLVKRYGNIALEPFLSDPDAIIRKAAVELALELKINGLEDVLLKAVKDPSPIVRIEAVSALEKSHNPVFESALKEAVSDPDEEVAAFAVMQLEHRLKPERFAAILVRFLNSKNEKMREFAVSHIAALSKERYKANYSRLSAENRKLLAKVIQKIDSGFANQIINDLSSLDSNTRLKAAMLMENITVGDKGKEALLAAIKDPSKQVRAAVVKTLGVIGDNSLLKDLISFFSDPDNRVKANAIEAISSLGDRNVIQILLPFLDDPNNRIRANAVVAIKKIGNFNVTPVLQKMLTHKNKNMKASGIWAIGEIKDINLVQFIMPMLSDPNEIVRANAIKTINKLNPQALLRYLPMIKRDSSARVKKVLKELKL